MYLTGAYRYDGEHSVCLGVSEQDVDEGDDLQRFAEAHAVSEDAAKATAAAETLHRLHQVVVQETDSTDLRRVQMEKRWSEKDKKKKKKRVNEGKGEKEEGDTRGEKTSKAVEKEGRHRN